MSKLISENEIIVGTPKQKLYYIQRIGEYLGNALTWWRPNGCGYTANINDAGKYDAKYASQIINTSTRDVAWTCDYIDNNLKARITIIDAQYIDNSQQIKTL